MNREYRCRVCGITEEEFQDRLEHMSSIIEQYEVVLEKRYGVYTLVFVAGDSNRSLEAAKVACRNIFGVHLFSEEDESLEDALVRELARTNSTVTTAESCTGGLVAGTIINVSGVSSYFNEGFVTYANEAKANLIGVSADTLREYGAVSEQTAKEMALGVMKVAGANASIATTGIAGPDGGTKEKPVGLVYIGCALNGDVVVKECHFEGNREEVRYQTVYQALNMLRERLLLEL